MRVPASSADIDPSWLTETLRAGQSIDSSTSVSDVRVEQLSAGVGFMGEVTRLHVSYSGGDGPATMMAKLPTQSAEVRAMLAPARVFEREARYYDELARQLPQSAQAYAVVADWDNDDYLLLLEDLSGMRIGDQAAGASADDAAAAMEAAAALHAEFWKSPRLEALSWMPAVNDDGMKVGREVYAASLPGFMQVFSHALDPAHVPLIERFGANVHQVLDRLAAMPRTLMHFDYRLDNLFFDGSGGVKMIDFQTSSKGGGAYDIGYFLSQNLATDVRRAHEDDLLRTYHTALIAGGGGDGYSFDAFRQDYRVGVLYGWIIPVFAVGTLDVSSERAMALWTEVIERAQAAMGDHEVAEFLTD